MDKSSIFKVSLPNGLNSAIELSKKNNPDLIIAQLEYEQSKKDTKSARSELAPTATLSFDRSKSDDLSSTIDEREKDTLKATVTWPFFSGGKNIASLKKNQSKELQKNLLLDNMVTKNQTDVASAWSSFQSSESALTSVRSQVNAAEIANEGITVEYETGLGRTTLCLLYTSDAADE